MSKTPGNEVLLVGLEVAVEPQAAARADERVVLVRAVAKLHEREAALADDGRPGACDLAEGGVDPDAEVVEVDAVGLAEEGLPDLVVVGGRARVVLGEL